MTSFLDYQLAPNILRAIEELGYEKPSPIQAAAWPLLLEDDCDFVGLAATGTGKTAGFSVPMLAKINPSLRSVQAVILCPTRELAVQVCDQVNSLGKYLKLSAFPIYGGASYSEQHRGLQQGLPIVVGTPGRICDHLRRGTLNLENLKLLILDEADEMISMGFKAELTAILDSIPESQSKTWLFSATMNHEVRRVADQYLHNPKQIQINQSASVPTAIDQSYFVTHDSQKPDVLRKLIDHAEDFYGLIFCQTKNLVNELTQYLSDNGYRVDSLHGDKSQAAREVTMRSFRERRVKVLICTDVAARGIDVKDVSHVINYSIPKELDTYVHRIGRTARCGKSGFAMSLITPWQRSLINQIEKLTKSKLSEGKIPTRKELNTKRITSIFGQFTTASNHEKALELLNESWKEKLTEMSGEEIVARFIAAYHPELFAYEDSKEKPGMIKPHEKPSTNLVLPRKSQMSEKADTGAPRRTKIDKKSSEPEHIENKSETPKSRGSASGKKVARRSAEGSASAAQKPKRKYGSRKSSSKQAET